jgi:hypothetical protein
MTRHVKRKKSLGGESTNVAVLMTPGAGFDDPLAVCLNTKAKGMWVLAHLAKFEINIGP